MKGEGRRKKKDERNGMNEGMKDEVLLLKWILCPLHSMEAIVNVIFAAWDYFKYKEVMACRYKQGVYP